jgi:hypothetical protein
MVATKDRKEATKEPKTEEKAPVVTECSSGTH